MTPRHFFRGGLGILAATFLVGCQGDPRFYQYSRNRPNVEEITGLWSLDVAASDWKPADPASIKSHTIELRPDGEAIVQNVPDVWFPDNRRWQGGYASGVGTWTTQISQDFWVLELNLREVDGKKPGLNVQLPFQGQTVPYQILTIIGDPDEGHVLVFRKKEQSHGLNPSQTMH